MLRTVHLIIIAAIGSSAIIIPLMVFTSESRVATWASISRTEVSTEEADNYPQIDMDVIEKYPPLYDAIREVDAKFENTKKEVCKPECPQSESGAPVIRASHEFSMNKETKRKVIEDLTRNGASFENSVGDVNLVGTGFRIVNNTYVLGMKGQ